MKLRDTSVWPQMSVPADWRATQHVPMTRNARRQTCISGGCCPCTDLDLVRQASYGTVKPDDNSVRLQHAAAW